MNTSYLNFSVKGLSWIGREEGSEAETVSNRALHLIQDCA